MTSRRLPNIIALAAITAFLAILAVTAWGTPILHSNINATHPIYLDCTTYPWNVSDDVVEIVWVIVTRMYLPFDVDVTTELPPPQPFVAWVVMGGPLMQPGNIAGQSVIGNWTIGTRYNTPDLTISAFAARVYADGLDGDEILMGKAAAHELGHQFGLNHQADGIMAPYLSLGLPAVPWPDEVNSLGMPQDSYGFLLNLLGPAGELPTPEPHLLALLPLLLMRRQRHQSHERPAVAGTSQISSIRTHGLRSALPTAASRFGAVTYAVCSYAFSPLWSLICPRIRYLGMGGL